MAPPLTISPEICYGFLTLARKQANATEAVQLALRAEGTAEKKRGEKKKEHLRVGWCALPEGTAMHLRMVLWPEAAHRLPNGASLAREAFERGQIILFAAAPAFRAAVRGDLRVMLNAVVYGPGFGAAQLVRP